MCYKKAEHKLHLDKTLGLSLPNVFRLLTLITSMRKVNRLGSFQLTAN